MDAALLFTSALAIALFPQVTAVYADPRNCIVIRLENRVPCGSGVIPLDQCTAAGCCFDSRYPGVPACYLNIMTQVNVVQPPPNVVVMNNNNAELIEFCKKCYQQKNNGLLSLVTNVVGTVLGERSECNICKSLNLRSKRADEEEGEEEEEKRATE